jgi:hypothetical protein
MERRRLLYWFRRTTNLPRRRHPARIVLSIVIAFTLGLTCSAGAIANKADPLENDMPADVPSNLGSLEEYKHDTGQESMVPPPISYVRLLGIQVKEDRVTLASGQQISGLAVSAVDRPGPGDDAGIRAPRVRALRTTAKIGLVIMAVGASAVFPPAVFTLPMVAKFDSSNARDVIVAIDAERTQDILDLRNSLQEAKLGEVVYLTIIRDGVRNQVKVLVPPSTTTTSGQKDGAVTTVTE